MAKKKQGEVNEIEIDISQKQLVKEKFQIDSEDGKISCELPAFMERYKSYLNNKFGNFSFAFFQRYVNDEGIYTLSPLMFHTFLEIDAAKVDNSPVLITGARGTGKELVAKSIGKKFCGEKLEGFKALNCGALPEHLLESELFGHKKGAFTGAFENRKGILEDEKLKVIFFDEVGRMSLRAQGMLLRYIANGEIQKMGENEPITIEEKKRKKLIFATNREPEQQIKEEKMAEDFYDRIKVFTIKLPTLAERGTGDVEMLFHYFFIREMKAYEDEIFNEIKERVESLTLVSDDKHDRYTNLGKPYSVDDKNIILEVPKGEHIEGLSRISSKEEILKSALRIDIFTFTLDKLKRYEYPGNVRDVENMVKRIIGFAKSNKEMWVSYFGNHTKGTLEKAIGDDMNKTDFSINIATMTDYVIARMNLPEKSEKLKDVVKEHCQSVVDSSGTLKEAAQRLGEEESTLSKRLDKYGITPSWKRKKKSKKIS